MQWVLKGHSPPIPHSDPNRPLPAASFFPFFTHAPSAHVTVNGCALRCSSAILVDTHPVHSLRCTGSLITASCCCCCCKAHQRRGAVICLIFFLLAFHRSSSRIFNSAVTPERTKERLRRRRRRLRRRGGQGSLSDSIQFRSVAARRRGGCRHKEEEKQLPS